MKANQLLLGVLLAGVIGASSDTATEDGSMGLQMTPAAVPLPIEGEMPSLDGATTWLNSPPLTPAGLRGKVVLVDFWTYTCINWLRNPAVRPRVGREVQGPGTGGDRRAARPSSSSSMPSRTCAGP